MALSSALPLLLAARLVLPVSVSVPVPVPVPVPVSVSVSVPVPVPVSVSVPVLAVRGAKALKRSSSAVRAAVRRARPLSSTAQGAAHALPVAAADDDGTRPLGDDDAISVEDVSDLAAMVPRGWALRIDVATDRVCFRHAPSGVVTHVDPRTNRAFTV